MDNLADVISSVLDAASRNGVGFKQLSQRQALMSGQAGVNFVQYVLEDATALRRKAVADSLSKANEIKGTLAKSGVKAGKMIGVSYSRDREGMWPEFLQAAGMETQQTEGISAVSSSPDQVIVHCFISYTYEVEQSMQ